MAIHHVGTGAMSAGTASTGTPALPTGVAQNDLLIAIFGLRPLGAAGTNDTITSSGWSDWPTTSRSRAEVGTADAEIRIMYKIAGSSESNPTFTFGTNHQGTTAGWSVRIMALRGVNTTTPSDANPVANTGTALSTFTNSNITTVTDGAWVLCAAVNADDNTTALATANNFTARCVGTGHATAQGGDHAVVVGTRRVAYDGSVTAPQWSESTAGDDIWAGLTIAIRPNANNALTEYGTATVFNGANGAAWPTGWTGTISGAGSGGAVDQQNNEGRIRTPNVAWESAQAINGTDVAEGQGLLRFRIHDPKSDQYLQFTFRHVGGTWTTYANPENGYFFQVRTFAGSNQLALSKSVDWAETVLATASPGSLSVAVEYALRIKWQMNGADLDCKAKFWNTADAEPGTWTLEHTITSPQFTDGRVGTSNSLAFGNGDFFVTAVSYEAITSGTTVTPGALQGTGTFPQSTISASAQVTPGAINGVGSFPTPTPRASALVTPSVLTSVLAFPQASISATGRATPAALLGAGSFGTPQLSASGAVAPATLQGSGTFPQALVFAQSFAQPATLQGAGSFGQAAISTTGRAAPNALNSVGSFGQALISATGKTEPLTFSGIGSFPTPTVGVTVSVAPNTLQSVGSFPQAAPVASGAAQPQTLQGAGAFPAPAVAASGRPLPATLQGSGAFPAVTPAATGRAAPAALQGVGSFASSTQSATGVAQPATLQGAGTFPQSSISTTGAGTATPQTLQGIGSFATPVISATGRTLPSTINSVGTFPTPTVGSAITVSPATLNGSGSFNTPTITVTAVVPAPFIAGVGSFGAPTISTTTTVLPNTLIGIGVFGQALIDIDTGEHPLWITGGVLSNERGGRVITGGESATVIVPSQINSPVLTKNRSGGILV